MNKATNYHTPVLLQACIEGLSIKPNGTYIDLTFGGGGHAKAIFEQLNSDGQLIVFDQDKDAVKNTWKADNFHFISSNFAYLKNQLRLLQNTSVDGILADLGVSSHQFDEGGRGFSIRTNGQLDMRMDQASELSALDVINNYDEEKLYTIFKTYGEVQGVKKVVDTVLKERQNQKIKNTGQLVEMLEKVAPKKKENKFLAQVFQAIRIEVNDEISALKKMLEQTTEVLNPGGRLVVMSYHSLEDRLVKNFMKRGNFEGEVKKDFYGNILRPFDEINRKPITPDENELINNPRSRSAKLRIAEKR